VWPFNILVLVILLERQQSVLRNPQGFCASFRKHL
jgi:hypothetical protein